MRFSKQNTVTCAKLCKCNLNEITMFSF